MVKGAILKILGGLGYELAPRDGRTSIEGVLRQAARNGLAPKSVIDVGAAYGDFTRLAQGAFPRAQFLMIEPLEEFRPALEAVPDAKLIMGAAAAQTGEATFNVHPDLVGSSLLLEGEDTGVNGVPRAVKTVALDEAARDLSGPYLLKVDVQGAELSVLEGASAVLGDCAMVILETSFLPFFDGGPLFADVVAWMGGKGFVPYDLFGVSHRPLDGALAQADVAFVPKGSPLRARSEYATAEQRRALTERLRR